MVTRRHNFLAALRCERAEQMPFVFTVDGFNYPVGLPERLLNPFDMVAIDRFLGSYVHERLGPSPIARTSRECTTDVETLPDGDQRVEYRTPAGTLRARYRPSSEANTAFLVDRCVTTPADYEALMALAADAAFAPDPNGLRALEARMADVGDDGIVYSCAPSTPIMDLTRTWVGLEPFLTDLCDHRDLVEATMAAMTAKACEEYEALARSTPARAIVFWDDVTSAYLSPDLFRRYVGPVYSAYADICHSHGKLLVAHACGHLKAFLGMLPATGIDAIDWVTPPPTGDTVFAEAQQAFAGRICVMGALAPPVMRFGTPGEVEDHVREVLRGVDLALGFVLMAPPPVGTPMANVDRVRQVVERDCWRA